MQFREQALAKLESTTDLGTAATLAKPRSLVALLMVTVLVAFGSLWAFTGAIPRQVTVPGILTYGQGSYTLDSPVSGQITGVFAQQGTTFPAQAPLFTVQVDSTQQTVRAFSGGRTTAILAQVGQVVTAGTNLAVVERVSGPSDPLIAVLYAPTSSAGLITQGSTVDLDLRSAPAQEYGVLRGVVQSVSQFSQTQKQIASFLGDAQLAGQFSGQGQPMQVVVRLLTEPGTTSGFRWSTRTGPPYLIDSRTLVSASVHLPSVRPIGWVLS
ncbi:HlyD family efflux transporter periplasmic adaptor subunit [Kitasatospora sp. NPDC048545]|uniref:HlyD family efflux transporter periplasmic adaptor subunit n=1 Tax=Kitasatospora sp. NPDC048545 TaxID=3157208 RepID=UPI0033E03CA4